MSWDNEKVAKLKELWGKGNTAVKLLKLLEELAVMQS